MQAKVKARFSSGFDLVTESFAHWLNLMCERETQTQHKLERFASIPRIGVKWKERNVLFYGCFKQIATSFLEAVFGVPGALGRTRVLAVLRMEARSIHTLAVTPLLIRLIPIVCGDHGMFWQIRDCASPKANQGEPGSSSFVSSARDRESRRRPSRSDGAAGQDSSLPPSSPAG